MQDVEKVYVRPERVLWYAEQLLQRDGLPFADAKTVAENLLFANLRGLDTHGVMRLPTYLKRLELGLTNRNAQPKVVDAGETYVVIDGDNGLGPIAGKLAMEQAMEKARESMVGLAFVRNSQHYGSCAFYTMMAMEQGMIGFSASNTAPLMAPTGGKKRLIGNNPISFAAPTPEGMTFVLDIALSNVAGGKIMLAEKNGQSIPLGWALDKEGRPTTDPHAGFTDGGLLLPVGNHKGYGMVVMLDILCGILSGGVTSSKVLGTTDFKSQGNMGTCFMMAAIDIKRLMPLDVFKARMGEMIQEIRDCPKAEGATEILLPGELEMRATKERTAAGIPITLPILRELEALGEKAGIGKLAEQAGN